MEESTRLALQSDRTIDMTTTGRQTGRERRVEIWFHTVDGAIYITGTPGTRDWYANLLADPSFTFHLKESVTVDLPATAVPITDPATRRAVLEEITTRVRASQRLDDWIRASPLVRVEFGAV